MVSCLLLGHYRHFDAQILASQANFPAACCHPTLLPALVPGVAPPALHPVPAPRPAQAPHPTPVHLPAAPAHRTAPEHRPAPAHRPPPAHCPAPPVPRPIQAPNCCCCYLPRLGQQLQMQAESSVSQHFSCSSCCSHDR